MAIQSQAAWVGDRRCEGAHGAGRSDRENLGTSPAHISGYKQVFCSRIVNWPDIPLVSIGQIDKCADLAGGRNLNDKTAAAAQCEEVPRCVECQAAHL